MTPVEPVFLSWTWVWTPEFGSHQVSNDRTHPLLKPHLVLPPYIHFPERFPLSPLFSHFSHFLIDHVFNSSFEFSHFCHFLTDHVLHSSFELSAFNCYNISLILGVIWVVSPFNLARITGLYHYPLWLTLISVCNLIPLWSSIYVQFYIHLNFIRFIIIIIKFLWRCDLSIYPAPACSW